jgi:hypothetical protein
LWTKEEDGRVDGEEEESREQDVTAALKTEVEQRLPELNPVS